MDTLNTGFIWEYDDNSFEEKNLLINSLPEGFKYRVKKLKIIEKSAVKEEVKFQAPQIQVNICEKDEAEKFIQMIKNHWILVWTSKLDSSLDVQTGF